MQENDHQHRFRSAKLTNFISFGESVISTGISKKPSRSTYSSKEIMELYCAIYMGRF
jgi:hypothetical protein